MTGYLANKAIVVTGAGRGIGRSIALACAAEGARVVVVDNGVDVAGRVESRQVAESVVAEIVEGGSTAVAVSESISSMEGGRRIVDAAMTAFQRLDGVVCAAGIVRPRLLHEMTEAEWDAVMDVHLKGTFTLFRHAGAIMHERGSGALIGFASIGYQGSIAQPNYSAAKGGIVSLVRSAALSLHRAGITANAIVPMADTRMYKDAAGWAGGLAGAVARVPNVGSPDDVAPLVVYLLSDKARHVTGQVFTSNGRYIAVWNQPAEVRSMTTPAERWTPQDIEARLDREIGQETLEPLR